MCTYNHIITVIKQRKISPDYIFLKRCSSICACIEFSNSLCNYYYNSFIGIPYIGIRRIHKTNKHKVPASTRGIYHITALNYIYVYYSNNANILLLYTYAVNTN